MNQNIISFSISNTQEDYAKCLYFIENGKSCDEDFGEKIKCLPFNDSINMPEEKLVNRENLFKSYDNKTVFGKKEVSKYVFYVNMKNEDDIINIIYYCLLNDVLGEKGILCVNSVKRQNRANQNQILRANLSDFLSYLRSENLLSKCYVWNDLQYVNLSNKRRIIKRFSPIFLIDEKKESVAYWRQSVQTFLLKLYKEVPLGGSNHEFLTDYFLPQIVPEELLSKEEKKELREREEQYGNKYWMIKILEECFCGEEKAAKSFIEERYKIWKSKELYDLVKDIPLLAMYIFCIFDYFLKKQENENTMEVICNEVFNARDMADGILQILENVYHSEGKRGYFCFRVHNNDTNRSGNYLKKQYCQYMESDKVSINGNYNLLEVRIIDYSHINIPQKFLLNFEKRKAMAEKQDIKKYENVEKFMQNICVADFFSDSDFWRNYNAISENIVNHYGLQIFDSFIMYYDGFFRVKSRESYTLDVEREEYVSLERDEDKDKPWGIPGTQYEIVIPFKEDKAPQSTSVNANINYTNYLTHTFKRKPGINFTASRCNELFMEIARTQENNLSYQEKKELVIRECFDEFKTCVRGEKGETGDAIIVFSANDISVTMIELFCKTIMLYVATADTPCYIMITECTQSHFVEICRMFALFYNKQGRNVLMRDTQIYLSGQDDGEEFLIAGSNLGEVVVGTEKLAFARCVHPECLKILKNMLKNRFYGEMDSNKVVSIVPFDMFEYRDGEDTLFVRNLKKVLDEEVQSEKFGCKLTGLHARIGSKIHIKTFYEAELLFHNSYYTSRFAYWMFKQIEERRDIDKTKSISLIGYENYSEMLLNELQNMLLQAGYQAEYIIYEQKATEKFRAIKDIIEYKDSQFILIVPINSTTSTHVKIAGFLKKTIREGLKQRGDCGWEEYQFTAINFGIVLISSEGENRYWKRVQGKQNVIKSEINEEEIIFLVEVSAQWSEPLECKECFPPQNYLEEVPLVETNKESVVPMQAIGIHRKSGCHEIKSISKDDEKKLYQLSRILIFDHLERNGNHYNYYFATEKLWEIDEIRQLVIDWLRENKARFFRQKEKVYNIIVAPLHFSNAAFVEQVNCNLFENAALVLHFDVNREYRTNIKTKYSNLQQLYDNLSLDQGKSIINFHFVDDTIVSGQTFYRTKSLIQSLINKNENSKVEINIFKSIILVLSRLSAASEKNYISDSSYFLAYFKLNISSMRVNGDACVLCKKSDEWNELAEKASLNEVYLYWRNKCKKIKCRPVDKIKPELKGDERHRRAAQYMIASHRAKTLLESLYGWCNSEEIRKHIIDDLLCSEQEYSKEWTVAMLKVLGRPFLSFRKEEKEAVFTLMLIMLDRLLQRKKATGEDKLSELLAKIYEDQNQRIGMVTILINRLVELKSNYIIRKENIYKILQFSYEIKDLDQQRVFEQNYFNRIKQLVGEGNDFTKCLYLEFFLLYGREFQKGVEMTAFQYENVLKGCSGFRDKLFIENTKAVTYGIEMLAECCLNIDIYDENELKKCLNENYFFDNFIQYLAFHKVIKREQNIIKVKEFVSQTGRKKLSGMIAFQQLYNNLKKESQKTEVYEVGGEPLAAPFSSMINYLCEASGAEAADIIVPYRNTKEDPITYLPLEVGNNSQYCRYLSDNINLIEEIESENGFVGNTYSVKTILDQDNKHLIFLKFCEQEAININEIPVVYMLFYLGDEVQTPFEVMNSIKNILMFRQKIWYILNISSNTLLQNWAGSLFYKKQMLKSRAIAHGEFSDWDNELLQVSEKIVEGSRKNTTFRKYFEMLLNAMIGYINCQILGGQQIGFTRVEYKFDDIWNGRGAIFSAAGKIWNLVFDFEDEEKIMSSRLRTCINHKAQYPEKAFFIVMLLAAIQNAYKHGEHKGNFMHIQIKKEGGVLHLVNQIRDEDQYGKKNLEEKGYRSGKGISMAVISDLCHQWYGGAQREGNSKLFDISSSNEFIVSLPIFVE